MVIEIVYEGRAGARVEVAGDLPDFRVHHALVEERPGFYRKTFELGVGIYRYKLLVDGEWTLDPRCSIVDRAEGVENNVVVVGGAKPPVHFAPDRRHIAILDDRIEVRLEIDEGAPVPTLLVDTVHVPLEPKLTRSGRVLLSGSARIEDDDELSTARLTSPPPTGDVHVPVAHLNDRDVEERGPAWIHGAVIYGIFLDRWRRGAHSPPERRMLAPTTPSTPFTFYGGDLDGVREHLGYIADLGVDAVAVTPVALSESAHRYDATDLHVVDPRIGGERALAALIEDCHKRKLKLIVDASFTHVSERHAAFQDVLQRQEWSAFKSWFRIKRFPVVARDRDTVELYYNSSDQPWLELDGPAGTHALAAALRLVDLGVDGLRLDAMDDAPDVFWRELRARTRRRSGDLLLLGETVTDALWQRAAHVDVVTDFRIRDSLVAFIVKRTMDARAFADTNAFHAHRTGAFRASFRLGFLDNHDTARFLSLCKDERKLRVALAILLFSEETAWITYGTEAHLAAFMGERALDSSWPERKAMPDPASVATPTLDLIRRMCALRKRLAGPVRVLAADGSRLVLERNWAQLEVDVDVGEPFIR